MIILSSQLLYIPEKQYYGWKGEYNLSSHLNSWEGRCFLFFYLLFALQKKTEKQSN